MKDTTRQINEMAQRHPGRDSYQLIADAVGVTRNAVAGALFRMRHPPAGCRAKGVSHNKTGSGFQPASYRPERTVAKRKRSP